jgi:uncharacterized phage protein (TIGR01671 family)
MNREIKFKVWDIENKSFLIDFSISKYGHLMTYDFHGSDEKCYCQCPNPNNYIIQQYTGLKDKNGNEIYEGDIIRFMGRWDTDGKVLPPDYKPYRVVWVMGGLWAMMINPPHPLKAFHGHNECVGVGHTDSEIIGNIFENPELLK